MPILLENQKYLKESIVKAFKSEDNTWIYNILYFLMKEFEEESIYCYQIELEKLEKNASISAVQEVAETILKKFFRKA
ncbi:hypothetical protein A9803_11150 [Listeria monocytogenes]|nr:hypothetical protein [Listeria monocytogenes]